MRTRGNGDGTEAACQGQSRINNPEITFHGNGPIPQWEKHVGQTWQKRTGREEEMCEREEEERK